MINSTRDLSSQLGEAPPPVDPYEDCGQGGLCQESVPVELQIQASAGGGDILSGDIPSCLDISKSIWAMRSAAEGSSIGFGTVIGEIFDDVAFSIVGGRLVGSLGSLGYLVTKLDAAAAEHLSHAFALEFLADLYTGYGCWTTDWEDRSSGNYDGAYYVYECKREWTQICSTAVTRTFWRT